MTVQTVVRGIELCALEPSNLGFLEVIVQNLSLWLKEVDEFIRLLGPEFLWVIY